jgi:hypothetical protein
MVIMVVLWVQTLIVNHFQAAPPVWQGQVYMVGVVVVLGQSRRSQL